MEIGYGLADVVVHLAVPEDKFPDVTVALSPTCYTGGKLPFKMKAEDYFTALLSSEESWPPLATDNCTIYVINVKIPANIFMARVLAEELIFSREAYSGNKTVMWSAESYEGCEVTISQWHMEAMGKDAWAHFALGRWYKPSQKECSACTGFCLCWAGGHETRFGGTSPRCSNCWHALYMERFCASS